MRVAHIPNYITVLRIIGTFGLIFTEPFGRMFYWVYFLTGVTDVLDGFLARKLNVTSDIGAKLDSVADVMFNTVMIFKILPELISLLPKYIWYIIGVMLILRIAIYSVAAIKFRKLASSHTIMNKVCGFLVFTVPFSFFISTKFVVTLCTIICALGMIALIEELIIQIKMKKYSTNIKSILS